MSDDLISRKALMDAIKKWLPKDPCGQEQSIEEKVATDLSVSMLMEIEEAPAAYDADAVIDKLEKLKESALDTWNAIDSEQDFGEAMAYKKAIEIVRNGGKKE